MDEIVVLEHGQQVGGQRAPVLRVQVRQVTERGTHAELVRSGGAYQRLWEAQRSSS